MSVEREPDVDHTPLHQRDPTARFSKRADDYVRYRPTYPAPAIEAMLDGMGDPRTVVAADIGAGTGISSRLLADRGVSVLAVEPNAGMRAMAEPHERVEWIDASAEATGLADSSVDLVVCAQAFHWFRQEEALREFHRILQGPPRGRLALMWNDDDPDDPVMRGYRAAVTTAANRDWTASNPFGAADLESRGPFVKSRELLFMHEQKLDRDGLVGRARSASYVPREGERFEQLARDLHALHAAHADAEGMVTLRYRTQLYLAEPAPIVS